MRYKTITMKIIARWNISCDNYARFICLIIKIVAIAGGACILPGSHFRRYGNQTDMVTTVCVCVFMHCNVYILNVRVFVVRMESIILKCEGPHFESGRS